jgi:hypothetical protein
MAARLVLPFKLFHLETSGVPLFIMDIMGVHIELERIRDNT